MPAPEEVSNLSVLRTDQVKAEEYRTAAKAHLDVLAALMDRARADGLSLSFQINTDQFGRARVADINIVKPL